jgi:hypothetical protein
MGCGQGVPRDSDSSHLFSECLHVTGDPLSWKDCETLIAETLVCKPSTLHQDVFPLQGSSVTSRILIDLDQIITDEYSTYPSSIGSLSLYGEYKHTNPSTIPYIFIPSNPNFPMLLAVTGYH